MGRRLNRDAGPVLGRVDLQFEPDALEADRFVGATAWPRPLVVELVQAASRLVPTHATVTAARRIRVVVTVIMMASRWRPRK